MINTVLTIIAAILGIAGGLLEKRYSPEAIKKRKDDKRDKEIANKDHAAMSKRLSDLYDRVRQDRYNSRQQKP